MAIYLDVIWFLNFCFDLLLLLLTGILLKRKIIKWRLVIGGLIGASIVLFMFSPLSYYVTHPFGKMIISLLMVYSAFGFKRFRYFVQNTLTFYFVTFMVGGGMLGFHYFLQTENQIVDGVLMTQTSGFGDPISWLFVVLGFPAIWYFSRKRIDDLETKKIQYDEIIQVSIYLTKDIHMQIRGLIDSGNQLYDPITKNPVMILDVNKIAHHLPERLVDHVLNQDVMNVFSTPDTEDDFPLANRIRLIPYRGVGQSHQFLLALKPESIVLTSKTETYTVKKALIGLNATNLSTDGDYECIVHPKMLQNTSQQVS
ncbi:sigma-E processing peptidase SpoIIGA [Metabacillus arenae]|uniref:Sigma-E processing peptidase SpoIIGA n=1 Tax=Metabacillus arenae TaxID=2771434 RepID=A0A926N9F2_9BACI|nr:sigma-E processing peptidase SpoIIGA [Metabacillus arenae]MBD1379942.1 sigma-E processing peptidase SpoIIGA [Metabacillus arenae]